MNKTLLFIRKQCDAFVYGFIGPFGMLYIFPRFFIGLQEKCHLFFKAPHIQSIAGSGLMWIGAFIALWCSFLMVTSSSGTPSPFSLPKKVLRKGPYRFVRHPMMLSITIVLLGEIIAWNALFLIAWLIIWLRFSVLFISRYEEPYLISVFGEEYLTYCRETPRWIPFFKNNIGNEK